MDTELQLVRDSLLKFDPDGRRAARVIRNTFDQLYDGQRTGRYRWDQLHKTEKTHCGTLLEINLRREFEAEFQDGETLDYRIAGVEVDCKYSQVLNGWMIPPEAYGHLCLVCWADDQTSEWAMGIVRPSPQNLGALNRDGKARLNPAGQKSIVWIYSDHVLPPNVLLQLDRAIVDKIMNLKSGQQRVNELFRNTLGLRVGRGVVATVAQQDDFMKRVRGNGGARTALQKEGIVILGQYNSHREIARSLGSPIPDRGESVPIRLFEVKPNSPSAVQIDGKWWMIAKRGEACADAPNLPRI